MADRVIQRNDTAARWQSINPILATGEIGIEIDGAKGYKIGDGKTRWNDLPYPANPTNVVQELGDDENAVISQKVVSEKLSELGSEVEVIGGMAVEGFKGERLQYDDLANSRYYSGNGYIQEDSFNVYTTTYYNVAEGDEILVQGEVTGFNVAAIVLLAEKGEKAVKVFDVSKENGPMKSVNRFMLIPEGIKYIGLSSSSKDIYRLSIYHLTNESKFEKIKNEIKQMSDEQSLKNKEFENLLYDFVDGEALIVSNTDNSKYYSQTGDYLSDSYNSFHTDYYAVDEGQILHLTGQAVGTISMFVLLKEQGGIPIEIYGKSTSLSEYTSVNEIITIPQGVKWIGRSYSKKSTTSVCLMVKNSRFNAIENDIEKLDKKIELLDSLQGKRLLAIGDSITAQKFWQEKVGEMLRMDVRTHAKGGIGIIQMVDGDGSGDAPEGYDPDNFGTSIIYKLNADDVKDVDIIVLMGFYNTRNLVKTNKGELTDMYPTKNTWYGQMNYAVKRVYEELNNANNYNCKVVICSAHKYGKYQYDNMSSYDDGNILLEATKEISDRHSLFFINLMDNGNINMYNWDIFQSSPTAYNPEYVAVDGFNDGTNKPFSSLSDAPSPIAYKNKYITIEGNNNAFKSDGSSWIQQNGLDAVWNGDQLHLNQAGGYRLGEYIAGQLLTI